MSRGRNDPRLFFSVNNIRAYHLQNGDETSLTPSGPQTLSLLMVPTSTPTPGGTLDPSEEDFYLHLHLPPELELPLPATTQIYHKPPRSYLIPRWDLGPEAGAFTRIEFPPIGDGPDQVSQDDVDTFETILAQCTAFLERSPPPTYGGSYNPATYGQDQPMGVEKPHGRSHGQIVLVDEENGSVVGELGEGFNVVESSDVKPGSKDPVAIELPQDGAGNVSVTNAMPEFLRTASHPAYAKSSLVQSSATASRLMMTTSAAIGNALQSGADSFTKKTKPAPTPMTFKPTTHEHVRKINSFTHSAAGISAKTVNQITKYAQNIGASISGTDKKERDPNKKPGILNKSLIAISTIGDGIEESARMLLHSGSVAASTVVGHRYGAEAGQVAHSLTGGVKNVGLVYIDATGVSRRAVIKSVAKGMVVGRMKDGQALVVGDGEQPGHGHGQPPHRSLSAGPQTAGIGPAPSSPYNPAGALSVGPPHIQRRPSPAPTPPPPYASNNGSSLGGTPMRGEKR